MSQSQLTIDIIIDSMREYVYGVPTYYAYFTHR